MTRVVKEPEERRSELIDTAEALFIAKGYDRTAVDDIVKKAKVAKGTFYHYFKSKNEILDAILDRYIKEIKQFIEETASIDGIDAVEKMWRISTFMVEYSRDHTKILDYVHEEKNANLHLKVEQKSLPMLIPPFAEIIKQGVQQGLFNTKHPMEAALAIMATSNAVLDDHRDFDDVSKKVKGNIKLDRKIEAVFDIIDRILGAKPGTFMKSFKGGR